MDDGSSIAFNGLSFRLARPPDRVSCLGLRTQRRQRDEFPRNCRARRLASMEMPDGVATWVTGELRELAVVRPILGGLHDNVGAAGANC